ncbi:MAG: MFS transporter [Actinomycetales bacterium]|nr:MFS transporter [Actinomycetales bacterium]
MIHVLTNPVYRRLFLAQVVALAGTGLATVALGLLAFDLAGESAGQVLGTALAIKMVAYVFVAPLAAALVVRWPRRAVMIGADVVRLAIALCLPFVGEIWQVYVLIFALQAASATFTPTFQSVVPDVLEDEGEYTTALSLSRLAYDLEAVLSPMLAALLLIFIPFAALFFGTAAGFAASALLVAATALPKRADAEDAAGAPGPEVPFGRRARRGIELFVRTPALRPVLALNLAVASAGAFVLVQTVVIVRTTFAQGDGVVALLLAANGAGSMAAAFALPRLLRTVSERRAMLTGAVLLSITMFLVPLVLQVSTVGWGLGLLAVAWALVGLGWSAVETPVGRIIRRNVGGPELPAAFAAQFSLSHACWLITYPLAGWLGGSGLGRAALVLAVVATFATGVAARLWRPAATPGDRSVPISATVP